MWICDHHVPCYFSLTSKLNFHFYNIFNLSRRNSGGTEKVNLNFYFHSSLWCFKRFNEGLAGENKTAKITTVKIKI